MNNYYIQWYCIQCGENQREDIEGNKIIETLTEFNILLI